ncbi:hypothetical protein NQ318_003134 [Aromia moschata]|uniref:Peptidase A2 domain-containing protein n=1 Tax=Aromia moschata TaxID=1265417 RepID=A0AAV8YRL6_9CUCU|nr:hypothetical protein NQ318_003134 [Aromia moschata]
MDDKKTVRRQNDDDKRTVKRQKGERKSGDRRTNGDDRRTNDDDKRTVRRQNDDDKRTVKRQKGERKSGDRRTNGDDRRTNDDDKRTETRRRGVIRKFRSGFRNFTEHPEEQQNDYDRIIGALEIRYGHKYLRQVYQSQIKSRQQRSNESLQEYEADIERLIHLAYPQAPKEFLEQIGIQTFIDGLVDTEMQQALRLGRHTTISDALIAALEFKAAKEASRSYKTRVRQVKFDECQSLKETKEVERRKWDIKDFTAQDWSFSNPKPKTSFQITSEKFGKRQLVDARGVDERSLIVHGYLDDKWCSFVIDTGATRTILRPDILPKSSKELSGHVKLETATGELIPVHGELNVKIQLGSKIMYHRVLTADIRDDCILGLDILSKHGFVVDVKNKTIQIQNEEIVMVPKLQDYNKSRRIIVEEDIQIPQGSENIIIAKLDGNGLRTGIVEASERNDGLLVARSLVQMNNQIPVRIANISDKKIILKKNEVLGRCEPVERVVKCEEVNRAQLNQTKNPEGQVARWMERLQQYNFKIMHRSGKTHGNADTLSRRPCLEQKCRYCQKIETKEYSNSTTNELLMATTVQVEDEWSSEELKKSQKKDSDLKLIRNWLKNGVRPTWQEVSRYGTTIKGYWAQWSSLCLRDGLLHRKWESPDGVSAVYQLVLPKARIHQVLEELHSSPSGGHFGVTRTLARLPTDLILGHPVEENQERSLPEFVEDLRERMDRIHRFAREKLKIHSDKMKQRLDTTSTETAFKPGDAVWLYAPKRTKGKSPKLQSNWEGPYTIIKKINDLVYRIQLSPRSKPKVVHLERLAKYTGHNPPDWFVVEDPPPRTEDSVIRDE